MDIVQVHDLQEQATGIILAQSNRRGLRLSTLHYLFRETTWWCWDALVPNTVLLSDVITCRFKNAPLPNGKGQGNWSEKHAAERMGRLVYHLERCQRHEYHTAFRLSGNRPAPLATGTTLRLLHLV